MKVRLSIARMKKRNETEYSAHDKVYHRPILNFPRKIEENVWKMENRRRAPLVRVAIPIKAYEKNMKVAKFDTDENFTEKSKRKYKSLTITELIWLFQHGLCCWWILYFWNSKCNKKFFFQIFDDFPILNTQLRLKANFFSVMNFSYN